MNADDIIASLAAGLGATGRTDGPIYRRLVRLLACMIADGRLGEHAGLPPERDLAAALGVGRVTVRSALRELQDAGLIEIRQGSGAFVAPGQGRIAQPLWRLTSFTEDSTARGEPLVDHLLSCELSPPSAGEAARLDLAAGEPVLRLLRRREAAGRPLALERAAVPAALLGGSFGGGSLYAALAAAGHRPVRALQRLAAIAVDAAAAAELALDPGAPALSIERRSWNASGRAIEWTQSVYRGDAYEFIAELEAGN